MSAKANPEQLINDLRTAQKLIRRASPNLVSLGIIEPGSEEARFLSVFVDVMYDATNKVIGNEYAQTNLISGELERSPFGERSGGFLSWVLRKAQT